MSPPPDRTALIVAKINSLEQANPIREPVLRSIVAALDPAPGSHGRDIG
jgi:hypothetical protein